MLPQLSGICYIGGSQYVLAASNGNECQVYFLGVKAAGA
jgi:hypothetical protein